MSRKEGLLNMLAVALNCVGEINGNDFGSGFLKHFDDFQVLKLNFYDDFTEKELQVCQPELEEALLKDELERLDLYKPLLELQGTKEKLQKTVRSMFFPGVGKKKYEKVLLTGCDGMSDFPWAVQIVLAQLPASGWARDPAWLRRADIIVLYGPEEEKGRCATRVKALCPGVPVFAEMAADDLSQDLKDRLEALFSAYLEKRKEIKEKLAERQTGPLMVDCEQARGLARTLGVNLFLVGSVCDEAGYRITRCGLGCF